MSEITVHFKNALNGYNKQDVDKFLKDEIEVRLRQKSAEIAELRKRVSELEAKLQKLTGGDTTVEQKIELYEKLMKKMDGDYENLLAPAVEKAKAIENKANREYQIRIDQAKYTAEGIYRETADRLAELIDRNLVRIYGLVDEYIRSKRLYARLLRALKTCGNAIAKAAAICANIKKPKKNAEKNRKPRSGLCILKKER